MAWRIITPDHLSPTTYMDYHFPHRSHQYQYKKCRSKRKPPDNQCKGRGWREIQSQEASINLTDWPVPPGARGMSMFRRPWFPLSRISVSQLWWGGP